MPKNESGMGRKFLLPRVFNGRYQPSQGKLEILMVLTLANVLQMLLTSIENLPILCVMPTTSIILT